MIVALGERCQLREALSFFRTKRRPGRAEILAHVRSVCTPQMQQSTDGFSSTKASMLRANPESGAGQVVSLQ